MGDEDGPRDKPTKLDKLIEEYMAQDTLDPSSTINFLMEADALKDPFADAPEWAQKIEAKRAKRALCKDHQHIMEHVGNDLARAYALNTHYMGSTPSELDHIQHMVVSGFMTVEEGRRHLDRNMDRCGCLKCQGGGVIQPMDEPYPMHVMPNRLPGRMIRD